MPRGNRPSTPALTRSGARKASEIVMVDLDARCTFDVMRFAERQSRSPKRFRQGQRRPRAIALTRRARRSIRVGRISHWRCRLGIRICLDFLDGGFCHGIESKSPSAASAVSPVLFRRRFRRCSFSHLGNGLELAGDALLEAIKILRQPEDVEEPIKAENRENMYLDQDRHKRDRQSGSLPDTIARARRARSRRTSGRNSLFGRPHSERSRQAPGFHCLWRRG